MSMVCEKPSTLHFEEHRSEATSVVIHRVPAAARDRFLELQRGITAAVEPFAGYRRTDLYPPADNSSDEWVVVVQFDDRNSLQHWLDSPQRAEWTKKFKQELGEYRLKTLSAGFGQWFVNPGDDSDAALPASWKMALTVWLGLYPTVMTLTLLVAPYTRSLGVAISILIGNALSVSILQWAVMPALIRVLRPWLKAPRAAGWAINLGGAAFVLLALAAFAIFFRQIAP
jgi:uncharacterized protein